MEDNRDKDAGNKEVFISYLNDDNQLISAYVIILDIDGFVTFKTNQNIIKIPRERVLKIKEKVENGEH